MNYRHTTTSPHDVTQRFFLPHDDLVFKDIFADPDDLTPARHFLSAALKLPADDLTDIALMNPALRLDTEPHRQIVFDVHLKTSGANIDIEIQMLKTPDFPQRLTYYAAGLLLAGLAPGQDYDQARRAICVAITDFNLTSDNAYASTHQMCNTITGAPLTDIMEIDLLELPKLPAAPDGTKLWGWLRFLAATTRKELDMAATIDPAIGQAAQKVLAFNEDEIKRAQAWSQWNNTQALKSREQYVHDQGIEQGIKQGTRQGVKQGRQEVARTVLAKGFSVSQVAELTGLTVAEVSALS